jgi:hypothetical protein
MTSLATAADPTYNLAAFMLQELAQFKREKAFDATDSSDFRVFYVGRDDVHGVLKYLLARCSRSLYMNMFGYDDDELDAIIQHLILSEHVFVQGTLDKSQAGGVHEKKIVALWSDVVRSSFAIGQSATHQISHTKGGVLDGKIAFEGSTNWSASGEGTIVAADGSDVGRKAQNNTLVVYTNPVEVALFTAELNEEHSIALAQQAKAA